MRFLCECLHEAADEILVEMRRRCIDLSNIDRTKYAHYSAIRLAELPQLKEPRCPALVDIVLNVCLHKKEHRSPFFVFSDLVWEHAQCLNSADAFDYYTEYRVIKPVNFSWKVQSERYKVRLLMQITG